MIIMHNKRTPPHHSAGFSMIDVLVAIIVLATALLALAALQGAMTRNTADSRARSQIAAFSEGLIEQARSASYDCVGSANAVCGTPTTSGTVAVTPNASGTVAQKAADAMQTAAGINVTSISEKVDTYYGVAGSFTTAAPNPVDSTTPQYKQLTITTAWTDATGQARTLSVDTIVSPIEIDTSNSLVSTPTVPASTVQTPIVREINPQAPGVIPIAVGNGNDTAATNPKPEILGSKSNQQVVGTSYNVLTYQAPDASNEVLIQKRVETQVVQCTCKYGLGSTDVQNDVFAQAYRPTYWDGNKYVAPDAVSSPGYNTNHPGADPGTNPKPILQSDYCADCCRDHHDQSSSDPKYVKFDPFNTDVNTQYKTYNYDVNNALVEAMGATDQYVAACRMIRVDGLYRTATDLQDYHFGLLATQTSATSPSPDDTFVTKYQTFVKDYLTQAYVSPATGPLTDAAANSLYATDGLDLPAEIDITYVKATPDKRYLHARGLYIDHLESQATQAISDALGTCSNSDKSQCVLPLLPFTTINATELATWCVTPAGTDCQTNKIIQVSNNAIIGGDPTDPQRGVVIAESTAKSGDTSTAVAKLLRSNSGVAVGFAVDPNDALNPMSDSQFFKVTPGGSSTSASFLVSLSGLSNLTDSSSTDDPSMSWQIGAASAVPCPATYTVTNGNKITGLDHYTCTPTSTSPTSTNVLVKTYNTTIPKSNDTNPCNNKKKATTYTCQNYQVDTSGVVLNGSNITPTVAVTGDGNLSEQSTITFATLDGSVSNTISIAFKTQGGATNAPYTCGADGATLTWTYPTFCAP